MSDKTTVDFLFEKTATEKYDAKFEAARVLAYYWEPGKTQSLNDHVRPPRETGFAYKASELASPAQTARRPPVWPTVLGGIVKDGSVQWEAVPIDSNSADSIASINVPAVTGLTIGASSFSGTRVVVRIEGGTVGETYVVSVEITTSTGEVIEVKLEVFIKGE